MAERVAPWVPLGVVCSVYSMGAGSLLPRVKPPPPGGAPSFVQGRVAGGDRSPVRHCDGRALRESVGNWPVAIITSDALGGTPRNR